MSHTGVPAAHLQNAAVGRTRGRYVRRTLNDRRIRSPRFRPPRGDEDWTTGLAYAVGLIATDGCLSSDRKTVVQVSKDLEILEAFRSGLGSRAPIRHNSRALRVQVVDVGLYDWLESVGLTPRKSLTLGPLQVPDHLFFDFVRGLLDGDGSIKTQVVVPNPRTYPQHTYQQLRVQFHSASERHLSWLRSEIRRLAELNGWMGVRKKRRHRPLYELRYSKHESMRLLRQLYQDPAAPRLGRKWRKWNDFVSHGKPTRMWSRRSGEIGDPRGSQTPVGESP